MIYLATAVLCYRRVKEIGGAEDKPLHKFLFLLFLFFDYSHAFKFTNQ